ncbi:signal peptidase II [Schaalia sp. lx-100]|uniref:signal peptidase II n=1 Tax=Schaalia sp. lx-100 TaxID=2899081 RepID=UPI001E4CEEA1|nr:signal peptidase II [Schaalia sp. lx-100]MCD4557060.1 signal peptidase II [Schaalia sp. lx-100]
MTTRPQRHIFLAFFVAFCAVVTDQMTKLWALHALSDNRTLTLIPRFLSLHLTYNSGAAFSLGQNRTWIFTLVSMIVVIALSVYITRTSSRVYALLAALLVGGAFGNLLDRLLRPPALGIGHVVDFIDYGGFFVGNVADIWIVLAACFLVLFSIFSRELPQKIGKTDADTTISVDSSAS